MSTTVLFKPGDRVIHVFIHSRNYRLAYGNQIVANNAYPSTGTFIEYTPGGFARVEFVGKRGRVRKVCKPERLKPA